jgi:hypothetical protein
LTELILYLGGRKILLAVNVPVDEIYGTAGMPRLFPATVLLAQALAPGSSAGNPMPVF